MINHDIMSQIKIWAQQNLSTFSASTLQLMAIVLMNLATVPSLLAVLLAWTDRMPQLDMVLLIWISLLAMFAQAHLERNRLATVVITLGFMTQSFLMALIFFQ